ncbi:glycosyltransferase [Rhabdochromatium marinum]|uniref:glycosyltransferase n=1 Tax=Rhabdochromatium marinum TaxID=48729 RepID=UPI001904A0C4|nr:glycosyltransferase [Rhabdochromatium marinum]MBK1647756.1 glycosyl transferase [Rhabdochromatium marinum]
MSAGLEHSQDSTGARITLAVPSFNHGRYLDQALRSIFEQACPVEVFLMDAGSSDETATVIERWQHRLSGWRSAPDAGQAAAINEGIARGRAPYVGWLNSDDWLLPGGLQQLLHALEQQPQAPMAYGRTFNHWERTGQRKPALVRPFNRWLMARLCLISQPGTLIRRSVWEALGGLDESLHFAMDYDLWWRVCNGCGTPLYLPDLVAVNREHRATKTNTQRAHHYREAISVVRRHYGKVPWKWWLAQPYAVWLRSWKRG